jgi:gliding motility-associated-like protein
VLWFSFSEGYLGTAASMRAPAKTDTIFSLKPGSSSSCPVITIYLFKHSNQDTLKLTQNFTNCENKTLQFTIDSEWKNVTWRDAKGISKGSGNSLDYIISKNEGVIGIGSNSNGCFIKQTENIKISKPNLVLEGTDYKILSGSSVVLGASGADVYSWQPPTGLDNARSSHPVATPDETITYTLTGYDSLGCTAQANVLVEVFHRAFVPNLFSPNHDGTNDELKIYGLSSAHDFRFSIYNREGSIVYESSDWRNVNWDGTKNGMQQPAGLYYWKVEGSFADGQPLKLNEKTKGSVLLVR